VVSTTGFSQVAKKSAGILAYRLKNELMEVFLVHPGGPFFYGKDLGAWSIPKGEFDDMEIPLVAAKREFLEETGFVPDGNFIELSPVKLKSGKFVFAWAVDRDIDETKIKSNVFEMEWPPKSGKLREFSEIDKAEWFDISEAIKKINQNQAAFLEELDKLLTIKKIKNSKEEEEKKS